MPTRITMQVTHPADGQWNDPDPEFITKEVTLTNRIAWIDTYTWLYLEGIAVYFFDEVGTGTFWHFTTERIRFEHF